MAETQVGRCPRCQHANAEVARFCCVCGQSLAVDGANCPQCGEMGLRTRRVPSKAMGTVLLVVLLLVGAVALAKPNAQPVLLVVLPGILGGLGFATVFGGPRYLVCSRCGWKRLTAV